MGSKSPMSVNKSQTPAWMKVVIIMVAASFAVGGVAVIFAGALGGGTPAQQSSTGGGLFAESYQPRVDAALIAIQSNPDNPDVVAQAGHAYYEWAAEVYQSGQAAASVPFWLSAVSYYDQVLAMRPDDEVVLGNKAFALYYASSPDAAAALEAFLDGAAGSQALAQQLETARQMLAEVNAQAAPVAPDGTSEETVTP